MYEKLVLIGNLTADPEMRYTPSGTAVTNFNLATTKKMGKERNPDCPDGWKDGYKGKNWELTTFWRLTAWRGLAETINSYCSKGSQVYVECEVKGLAADGVQNPRVWSGQDGVPRANFEATVRMCKFIGGRKSQSDGDFGDSQQEPPPGFIEEEDIPF